MTFEQGYGSIFASVSELSNRILDFIRSELLGLDPVLYLNVSEELHIQICLC